MKDPIKIYKVIPMEVQLGDLRVNVLFGAVNHLAVVVFLGTCFIYRENIPAIPKGISRTVCIRAHE